MGVNFETGVPGEQLTDEQINTILAIRDQIGQAGINATSDTTLKIFVGFDGTKGTDGTTVISALKDRESSCMVHLKKAHRHHPANRFTARTKQEYTKGRIRVLTY